MHDGKPVLLFACEGIRAEDWLAPIRAALPEVEVWAWPDAPDAAAVDFGFAWNNAPGFWRQFPNLRAIFGLGAGVDRLMADATLPGNVPVVRMLDPELAIGMSEFTLMRVMHHHRLMHRYEQQQLEPVWRPVRPPLARDRVVGVMGLGEMGGRCALDLLQARFQVRGWSRRPRELPGVSCFNGDDQLAAFADGCEILVCVLPLTPATKGVLNAALFDRLAPGACLISIGRGPHLVEADLLAALASGQIEAATLDVFAAEPLPRDHPFWTHPAIRVVPHSAAFTYPETAATALAENIRMMLNGQQPEGVADRRVGY